MAKVDLARVGKNLVKSAESGESVELQTLWQDQPVVLLFLRRFGCQVCRWMASEVSKLEPELRASGVGLVGVAPEEFGLKEFKEGGFFKGCGEQVLLHFIQDSPGDHVALEDISKALGISATAKAGQKPVCNDDVCTR
uniref:Alkyl hydroperoxide reductase subunit C/ Thiol specific antioxidant domain-containing protein n=1 Tax=Amphiprion ocellaris TaxID=80972 RepID=A0AAQ5ZQP3_AMPOC